MIPKYRSVAKTNRFYRDAAGVWRGIGYGDLAERKLRAGTDSSLRKPPNQGTSLTRTLAC